MIKKEINFEKLWKSARDEADWLRYYGHNESRMSDEFNDDKFYDRIESIGYTKRVIPLHLRCPMVCISSDLPMDESTIKDIYVVSGPRNHSKNIYTPLEFFIGKKIGTDQLIKIIKGY
jgi:hypothetical protein